MLKARTALRIEVQDTGIGILPEQQERIFDAFAQVDSFTAGHYSGTGLGLDICKRLVNLLGGNIGVTSTPGEGSTFWFTIPVTAQKAGRSMVAG